MSQVYLPSFRGALHGSVAATLYIVVLHWATLVLSGRGRDAILRSGCAPNYKDVKKTQETQK